MTITREDVADLQPGDVVELRNERWPEGTVIRGPLHLNEGRLECGPAVARWSNGDQQSAYTLTVVSRAPRPLYVNHPRTEPVPGDSAHPGDGTCSVAFHTTSGWIWPNGTRARVADHGLRLLVDGETGLTVPTEQPADPLAHVRQGDPTPESANATPACAAKSNGYLCTRERGHVGQHIAGTGVRHPVAAVWL